MRSPGITVTEESNILPEQACLSTSAMLHHCLRAVHGKHGLGGKCNGGFRETEFEAASQLSSHNRRSEKSIAMTVTHCTLAVNDVSSSLG